MNKILVSVFDTETAASEGMTALKELHRDGDITLYASTVLAKRSDGTTTILQSDDDGPVGTLVGLVGGSLLGLIGGPVGAAVGGYLGTFGGLMFDLFNAGVGMDFVNEVAEEMAPGKVAVIADIDETWVVPVETRLSALGATTFRRLPDDVVDDQLLRESQAAEQELDELQAELRQATSEDKAKVEAAIAAQREKLNAIVHRIDTALDHQRQAFEARLATLRAQRAQARERQKAQIDARMDELKASNAARRAKLQQARELAKQSAALTREAIAI